jgi:hypothetical protein
MHCRQCDDPVTDLRGPSQPERVVYFFWKILDIPMASKEALSQRAGVYRAGWKPMPHKRKIRIEKGAKGLRKEVYVLPALRRMEKQDGHGA